MERVDPETVERYSSLDLSPPRTAHWRCCLTNWFTIVAVHGRAFVILTARGGGLAIGINFASRREADVRQRPLVNFLSDGSQLVEKNCFPAADVGFQHKVSPQLILDRAGDSSGVSRK
jgi:hypothetical protein